MNVTAFQIATRFGGMTEVAGPTSNPQILAMLRLDDEWPRDDEVPWCSAFVNYIAWLLRLPRSKSLLARSWLGVGIPIEPPDGIAAFDVVILKRGNEPQPGPASLTAPGHVGFFAGCPKNYNDVIVLGGNQSNSVSLARYPLDRVLGVRRLA